MKEEIEERKLSEDELVVIAKAIAKRSSKKEWNRYIKGMRKATGMEEASIIQDDLYTMIIYVVYIVIIEDPLPDWVYLDLFLNGEGGKTIERALEIADEMLFSEESNSKNLHPDCSNAIESFARA